MNSHIFLDIFIKNYNNDTIITSTAFNDLYDTFILKSSYDLKTEIREQMLLFPDLKENYLEYLYKRITSETQYDPDTSILEKWIQDYQLQNLDFPFTANSQINEFLDSSMEFPDPKIKEPYLIEAISKYFYKHAFYLEKINILELIQIEKAKLSSDKIFHNPISDLNPIFNSLEGFEIFSDLLEHLGVNMTTINNRGIKARLAAIWKEPTARKIIFKEITELKEYVNYLNETFELNLKSRSLSNSDNYHQIIKNWLEQ
jgi:hypothetical protein